MKEVIKEFISTVKTISENGKTIERLLFELHDSLGRVLEGAVKEIEPCKTNVVYRTSRDVEIEEEILPVVESRCDDWLHDGKRLHLGLLVSWEGIYLWVEADQNRHVLFGIDYSEKVELLWAGRLVIFLSKNVCSAIVEMLQEALKKCESVQDCAIERLEKMVKAVKKMSVPVRIAQASSS